MKKLLFGLLILALLVSACGGVATSTPQPTAEPIPTATSAPPPTAEPTPTATEESAAADQARTLDSLRRLDDWPLYEMHYYGDYGFDSFLQAGIEIENRTQSFADEWACTCFAALNEEGDLIFGRNFDWHVHPALILFTDPPNAYASVSMVDISYLGYGVEEPSGAEREALLVAPYLPFDGLNEQGLAVGIMAVNEAEGGDDPDKVTIGSLDAVRLLLDYARDVDEAISLLASYNVDFEVGPPLHYLVADSAGNSAVIEFIGGEVRAIPNSEPWQVATNFVISGTAPESRPSLCPRYLRATETLEEAEGSISLEEAMALLEGVSQSITIWSVVYDMTNGAIQVVVGREYEQVYQFALEMGNTD
jgi:predicted choloylglycine hydrolase